MFVTPQIFRDESLDQRVSRALDNRIMKMEGRSVGDEMERYMPSVETYKPMNS